MSLAHDVQQHLGQFAGRYVEYPGRRGHVARPTVGGLHLALQRAGEPHRTEHGVNEREERRTSGMVESSWMEFAHECNPTPAFSASGNMNFA